MRGCVRRPFGFGKSEHQIKPSPFRLTLTGSKIQKYIFFLAVIFFFLLSIPVLAKDQRSRLLVAKINSFAVCSVTGCRVMTWDSAGLLPQTFR